MSKNKQSIEFYRTLAENVDNAKVVKFSSDYSHYDIDFIRNLSDKKESLLDLGSGTGLIVNNLTDDFKDIVAVELFEEFSNYINGDNITICNENLIDFFLNDSFGMITMFGTAHYFDEKESLKIFQNVFSMLKNNGIFILKNQFGINKTKTVNSSKDLGDKYFAQYRFLHYEIERLKKIGFEGVLVHDIYPSEANRWSDTHFYALVCKKNKI
jgi:SAM-dependent methyltransferase